MAIYVVFAPYVLGPTFLLSQCNFHVLLSTKSGWADVATLCLPPGLRLMTCSSDLDKDQKAVSDG
jgi:hypothetical protein